jgi:hypothetical protein
MDTNNSNISPQIFVLDNKLSGGFCHSEPGRVCSVPTAGASCKEEGWFWRLQALQTENIEYETEASCETEARSKRVGVPNYSKRYRTSSLACTSYLHCVQDWLEVKKMQDLSWMWWTSWTTVYLHWKELVERAVCIHILSMCVSLKGIQHVIIGCMIAHVQMMRLEFMRETQKRRKTGVCFALLTEPAFNVIQTFWAFKNHSIAGAGSNTDGGPSDTQMQAPVSETALDNERKRTVPSPEKTVENQPKKATTPTWWGLVGVSLSLECSSFLTIELF